MPAEFSGLGIHFVYPDNWELSREDSTDFPRTVSVHSPTGAFWSVTMHPGHVLPQIAVQEYSDAMRQEYDSVEIEPIEMVIDDEETYAFELNFYCLDFLITSRIIAFDRAGLTVTLCYQAESREFEALLPVFGAVTHSLLETLGEVEASGDSLTDNTNGEFE